MLLPHEFSEAAGAHAGGEGGFLLKLLLSMQVKECHVLSGESLGDKASW
jgi:hypothetical protein